MTDQYVYRWHCDVCKDHGEWYPTDDEARTGEKEHCDTHDEPLYEPTRIQRYKREDAPGLNNVA